MRAYELCLILQSDISDDNIENLINNFSKKIEGSEGTILSVDKQGRKSLKYPIKKQHKGFYCFIQYRGNNNCLAEINRLLKFNDQVLRFNNILIKENEIVDIKPEPVADEIKDEVPVIDPDMSEKENENQDIKQEDNDK